MDNIKGSLSFGIEAIVKAFFSTIENFDSFV